VKCVAAEKTSVGLQKHANTLKTKRSPQVMYYRTHHVQRKQTKTNQGTKHDKRKNCARVESDGG